MTQTIEILIHTSSVKEVNRVIKSFTGLRMTLERVGYYGHAKSSLYKGETTFLTIGYSKVEELKTKTFTSVVDGELDTLTPIKDTEDNDPQWRLRFKNNVGLLEVGNVWLSSR